MRAWVARPPATMIAVAAISATASSGGCWREMVKAGLRAPEAARNEALAMALVALRLEDWATQRRGRWRRRGF